MGRTAGMHTQDRDAAIRYGAQMPAARVVINSPTTHGAVGFSTDLPPSMTIGCGSWGGNVTSDNVSPIHLMDVKRVAFETRPVASSRPANTTASTQSAPSEAVANGQKGQSPTISREEITGIVDRLLANRPLERAPIPKPEPAPVQNSGTVRLSDPAARRTNSEKSANGSTSATSTIVKP